MGRIESYFVHFNEQHGGCMKTKKIMEGPRDGEVRCLACFTRFRPLPGASSAECPRCGIRWRISWPYPKMAKVRGPVWDTYPGGAEKDA